jgi:hypothetical protein
MLRHQTASEPRRPRRSRSHRTHDEHPGRQRDRPIAATTRTDTSSQLNPGKVAGAAERKPGLEAHRQITAYLSPLSQQGPVPDHPTPRPGPDGPSKLHLHAAKLRRPVVGRCRLAFVGARFVTRLAAEVRVCGTHDFRRSSESPITQMMAGDRPTNTGRRSALPRPGRGRWHGSTTRPGALWIRGIGTAYAEAAARRRGGAWSTSRQSECPGWF